MALGEMSRIKNKLGRAHPPSTTNICIKRNENHQVEIFQKETKISTTMGDYEGHQDSQYITALHPIVIYMH